MRTQFIFTFAALAVTSILIPHTWGMPLPKRHALPGVLGSRAISAPDVLTLPVDQFNALVASILDNPTQLQAEFVTDVVYGILDVAPPDTSDGTISDDVKAAFLQIPIDQQRTIIEVAVGSAGLDSEMSNGSVSSATPAAASTNATDVTGDSDASDLPEGVTPAGQVAKSGSAADTDSSTTLDLPVGSTPASNVVNGTDNSSSSSSSSTATHKHTHTATSSVYVLNPTTTGASVASTASATASDSDTRTDSTTTPTPTAAPTSTTTTSNTTSTTTASNTTSTALPTSTVPASYWYTKPTSTVALYLRCIDKAQADALVTTLKAKAGITAAEIASTESEIAVYQVGPAWVKPDWCTSESASTTASVIGTGTVATAIATATSTGSSTATTTTDSSSASATALPP